MNQIAELLKKENKALSLIDIVDKSGLEPEEVMRQLQEAQAAGLVFLSKKKNCRHPTLAAAILLKSTESRHPLHSACIFRL